MNQQTLMAMAESSPHAPPQLRVYNPLRKFSLTMTFSTIDMDPKLFDLLVWGESPPPHIVLGED